MTDLSVNAGLEREFDALPEFASNPYITFQWMPRPGAITHLFEVITRDGDLLGVIKWFGRWRQYSFFPEPETVFNNGCLRTITSNIEILNDARKGRSR